MKYISLFNDYLIKDLDYINKSFFFLFKKFYNIEGYLNDIIYYYKKFISNKKDYTKW